jgi:hypothetical protein
LRLTMKQNYYQEERQSTQLGKMKEISEYKSEPRHRTKQLKILS